MRNTIHKYDEADLVLYDYTLIEEYKNKKELDMFSKVLYGENGSLNIVYKFFSFLCPSLGIKKNLKLNPKDYKDVFFYNPTWIYYYLYKYSVLHGNKYKWHFLFDGGANYHEIYPKYFPLYSKKSLFGILLNRIDFEIFKYSNYEKQEIDMYVWGKGLVANNRNYEIIEVPQIDVNDKKLVDKLNKVFRYEGIKLENKIVFLDVTTGEGVCKGPEVIDLIKKIGLQVGRDRFLIKRHPRVSIEKYEELSNCSQLISTRSPWEVICLNNNETNMVVIGLYSTSTYLPSIIGNQSVIYDFSEYMTTKGVKYSDEDAEAIKKIRSVMSRYNVNYHYIDNDDELNQLLNSIK